MSNETQFIEGLIAKPPHENAPDFVIAKLSIKREELIEWLEGRDDEWINADVKESRGGKWYVAVDDWKPQGGSGSSSAPARQRPAKATDAPADDFADDDIPFIRQRGNF